MGQCVLRDCGFDVERRNNLKNLALLSEDTVKHKYPLPKKQEISQEFENGLSEEEKDVFRDIRKKYNQNRKTKGSLRERDIQIQTSDYRDIRSYDRSKVEEQGEADTENFPYSVEALREIEQELYQVMYLTTPNFKDQQTLNELANKATLSKDRKFSYGIHGFQDGQETVKQNKLITFKESNGGAKYSNKSANCRDTDEDKAYYDQLDDKKAETGNKVRTIISIFIGKKGDVSLNNSSDHLAQDQYNNSRYIEDKGSLFGDSEVIQYNKNQKPTSPEVVMETRNVRGRVIGFENVFFKDNVKNARSRTHSPDEIKNVLLPDEISDSDFDFDHR